MPSLYRTTRLASGGKLEGVSAAPVLTFLSNGHGEDAVGVILAEALRKQRPDLTVQALPTVGEGQVYEASGIPVVGPRRSLPSGGLLMHSVDLLVKDLRAGFLGLTWRQLTALRRLQTDALIIVGDVYAAFLSAFVPCQRRFFVQSLVSAQHAGPSLRRFNRLGMEHIGYFERALMRQLMTRVYVRDVPTAEVLQAQGLKHVLALGNPMLDALTGRPMPTLTGPRTLALLPGTRAYAAEALLKMCAGLEHLSEITALVAWAGDSLPHLPAEWQRLKPSDLTGLIGHYGYRGSRLLIFEGRFADILATARVVIGTAGTANEQAAALGKPVVSFAIPPYYADAFLRNQKSLLGEALTLTADAPETIAQAVLTLLQNDNVYSQAARAGQRRMGAPGGAKAIVADILSQLEGKDG